jgi:integrase
MASTRRQTGWSYRTGEKGENRVRVFERGGPDRRSGFWIDYRDESGRHRQPLAVADRRSAKLKAEEIAAAFRKSGTPRQQVITLGSLVESYAREVTPTKGSTARAHDGRGCALFLTFFGPQRRPETLSRREWDAYIQARRSGKLRPPKAVARQVGWRVIEQDLHLLNAILNWAVQAGDGRGDFLLGRNPFKGLPVPKEESPQRPLLSVEQYESIREAAAGVSSTLECFVVLAWHTGHRAASLRQLQWADIDFEKERVHFRGDRDKIGLDHWNPLHATAISILRRERDKIEDVGDAWIFPSARDGSVPLSRDAIANLWKRLAAKAVLPEGERYGWHSLRRAFANRYRRAPLRDLQDLGGWKSSVTLMTVYLRPDESAQREVLAQFVEATPLVASREQAAPRTGTNHLQPEKRKPRLTV